MKVWLLFREYEYEGEEFMAVYASKEAAEYAAAKSYDPDDPYATYRVEERDVRS